MDASALAIEQDYAFQSLTDWSYWEATTNSNYYAELTNLTEMTLNFSCTKPLMDQYVAMLQETGFELVYHTPDDEHTYYNWKLKYVGMPRVPGLGTTSNGETYHLEIDGFKGGKYYFQYTTELEMKDLGLRIDGAASGIDQYG